VALRIAFDLDGVLADMDAALAREAEALFGRRVERMRPPAGQAAAEPPAPAASLVEISPPRLDLTTRQNERLWRHVEQINGFWEGLAEIESGSVARLAALADARRWEILFLTRRPVTAGDTAQRQSQRWLEAKGFRLPSVYVVQGSRGRVAAALALDIVVDDRPENCLDVVVDSDARAILVWRDDDAQLPGAARRLGIGVVKSVGECLDILTDVDEAGQDRPTLLERVRRALGLTRSQSAGA
jgi:hypothetical protein